MKEGGGTMDTVALETSPVTFAASPRKGLRAADERCVCKLGGDQPDDASQAHGSTSIVCYRRRRSRGSTHVEHDYA